MDSRTADKTPVETPAEALAQPKDGRSLRELAIRYGFLSLLVGLIIFFFACHARLHLAAGCGLHPAVGFDYRHSGRLA